MYPENFNEKKEYIAKIACEVFASKGYKESSLQDVSIKGNISKAGIYHYFKTKEDILAYVLLRSAECSTEALMQCLKVAGEKQLNPKETVEAISATYANYLLENPEISQVVLRDRHQLRGDNKKALLEKEKGIFQIFRNQLRKLPNINHKININLISFHIISMVHWMGYWFDGKGSLLKNEAIDQTVRIIFDGILERKK
jgi:AcrR family transcriptional regulator